MQQRPVRAFALSLLVLGGCAATRQEMAQQSNWDVCRYTMGGPHSEVAEYERQRRSLDCTPYYPAIAAKLQAENAALANFLQATQPPPQPAPRNCTTTVYGNTAQTRCW
jgi:hypothetical protein